eukprot:TRINITY_DN17494_c0_g1_i1.p1 TRINITY_DN17494_c0_g1~~TRINITY_DN17494_c0_g1_i1.p1  ORF type:complete len:373 (+),score=19.79 TRINITY_DN17494_c0_g1_i1:27-1121(+)
MEDFVRCLRALDSLFTERESKMIQAKNHWQDAVSLVQAINSSDEVVSLDVGGTEIRTFREKTFSSERCLDSMLGAWLSGQWEWQREEEDDGQILIDRDGQLFQQAILTWLRDGPTHALFNNEHPKLTNFHPTSLLLFHHEKQDWVQSVHRESVYFGLTHLTEWCEQVLAEMVSLSQPIFDHFHHRALFQDWFDVGEPMIWRPGGMWLTSIAPKYRIPAATGEFAFFVEVLESPTTLTPGFICECSTEELDDDASPHKMYDWKSCAWLCSCLATGQRHDCNPGSVVGAHIGWNSEAKSRCYWFTLDGQLVQAPKVVQSHKRVKPGPQHFLVPFLTIDQPANVSLVAPKKKHTTGKKKKWTIQFTS